MALYAITYSIDEKTLLTGVPIRNVIKNGVDINPFFIKKGLW
jgi:hypothetical protein